MPLIVFLCFPCGLFSHCLNFLKVASLNAVAMAADSRITSLSLSLRSSPVDKSSIKSNTNCFIHSSVSVLLLKTLEQIYFGKIMTDYIKHKSDNISSTSQVSSFEQKPMQIKF